jgi:hypothetical protein
MLLDKLVEQVVLVVAEVVVQLQELQVALAAQEYFIFTTKRNYVNIQ